ncbi:MAG: hypothetical protein K8L99_05560 [Anaerolineae bacterium]|nr:hypothetical protein [Anaerolineae bacterium]
MGVLILLIVVDLLIVGAVMYFVLSEKEQKHDHYVPAQQAGARDWAVQTTSDAEIKGASAEAPTKVEEAAEETSEAADELEEEDGDTESKTQSS